MKKQLGFVRGVLLCVVAVLAVWSVALAQRIVDVTQGVGTLNEFIRKDTLANGKRVDINTIYRLQRGGFYLTNATIENTFPLRIEAASGTGLRPKIYPAVVAGGISSPPFGPKANLTLRGLYISDRDELGLLNERTIRVKADSVRVIVDDCHIDQDGQAAVRLDTKECKVYLTNSIISNMGHPNNPGNGRGIDDRGNLVDTLVIENCTFYNVTDRVIRDGGQLIRVCRFNHNTIVNVGHEGVSVGQVATLQFTNNLFVNIGFRGKLATETTEGAIKIDSVTPASGLTNKWLIAHNNVYTTKALLDTLTAVGRVERIRWSPQVLAYFQALPRYKNTITEEAIAFTEPPADPAAIVSVWYRDTITSASYWANIPMPDKITSTEFNLAYPTTMASYRASAMGQPLGDLRWFNMTIIPTSVAKDENVVPAGYELDANYPNPFNPETWIKYALPIGGRVTLAVYNVLGQRVATLVNGDQDVGSYTVRWNGVADTGIKVASGIYFYQLHAGTFVSTKKMVMAK